MVASLDTLAGAALLASATSWASVSTGGTSAVCAAAALRSRGIVQVRPESGRRGYSRSQDGSVRDVDLANLEGASVSDVRGRSGNLDCLVVIRRIDEKISRDIRASPDFSSRAA